MRKHKLTEEQRDEAIALREAGAKMKVLVQRYRVSVGSLSWLFLKAGVITPGQVQRGVRAVAHQPRRVRRGASWVYRFTPEEDRLILKLACEGVYNAEIGRRLDPPRKPNSITGRLATLARHDELQELRADAGLDGRPQRDDRGAEHPGGVDLRRGGYHRGADAVAASGGAL